MDIDYMELSSWGASSEDSNQYCSNPFRRSVLLWVTPAEKCQSTGANIINALITVLIKEIPVHLLAGVEMHIVGD
jgi:hypothetical protein